MHHTICQDPRFTTSLEQVCVDSRTLEQHGTTRILPLHAMLLRAMQQSITPTAGQATAANFAAVAHA